MIIKMRTQKLQLWVRAFFALGYGVVRVPKNGKITTVDFWSMMRRTDGITGLADRDELDDFGGNGDNY
jgi:hypothetical protein